MLKSRLRLMAVFLCSATLLVFCPSLATAADGPVSCPPNGYWDPTQGTCVITVITPPGGGGGGGTGGGGTGGGGTGGGGQPVVAPVCTWIKEIPCTDATGANWDQGKLCYVFLDSAGYPPDNPIWAGHYPEGAIYTCYNPFITGTGYSFWAAAPAGAAPPPPPDPAVLARQAVAAMNLQAVTIGIVPEPLPGRVGLIGLPTWMWVLAPAANTMGPVTKSASAGGTRWWLTRRWTGWSGTWATASRSRVPALALPTRTTTASPRLRPVATRTRGRVGTP